MKLEMMLTLDQNLFILVYKLTYWKLYIMVFGIFLRFVVSYIWIVRHVIFSLLTLVVLGGILLSIYEDYTIGDSLYLSFITAFTIGYGDITPHTLIGKILSIFLGLIGIIFTGLVVAVSTRALASTIEYTKERR